MTDKIGEKILVGLEALAELIADKIKEREFEEPTVHYVPSIYKNVLDDEKIDELKEVLDPSMFVNYRVRHIVTHLEKVGVKDIGDMLSMTTEDAEEYVENGKLTKQEIDIVKDKIETLGYRFGQYRNIWRDYKTRYHYKREAMR